jgi:regulator of protease activity HflC (stomatin/prohibitin superfamily)
MSKKSQPQTEQTQSAQPPLRINGVALTIAIFFLQVAFFAAIGMGNAGASDITILVVTAILGLIGVYFLLSLKIAAQWEKAAVLRTGKFRRLAGPGVFWIIPIADSIANWTVVNKRPLTVAVRRQRTYPGR